MPPTVSTMPRPRLTLGRLMAWIAFTALNLWVLGTIYRRTYQRSGDTGLVAVAGMLGLIYLTAYIGHRLLQVYRAQMRSTPPPPPTLEFLTMIGLAMTALVLLILVGILILTPALYGFNY